MTPEEAIRELQEHGKLPARVEYEDGTIIECRLALSTRGRLIRMFPRKRKYGTGLGPGVKDITLDIPPQRTPAQEYVTHLRRLRNYVARFGDPRAWEDYRTQLAAITEGQLAAFEGEDCRSWYEAWERAPAHGLPRIERFESTTLRTCGAPPRVIEGIKEAFGEREFSTSWRGTYDCTASGSFGADGQYRAWLSCEYQGCANGHYYLLISDHQAVFVEDD